MKWMRAARYLATGTLVVAAASAASAQTGTARITGTVTDRTAGAPVANVAVIVVGSEAGARTGPDGKFTIAAAPTGSQRVRASRIGYSPTRRRCSPSSKRSRVRHPA